MTDFGGSSPSSAIRSSTWPFRCASAWPKRSIHYRRRAAAGGKFGADRHEFPGTRHAGREARLERGALQDALILQYGSTEGDLAASVPMTLAPARLATIAQLHESLCALAAVQRIPRAWNRFR